MIIGGDLGRLVINRFTKKKMVSTEGVHSGEKIVGCDLSRGKGKVREKGGKRRDGREYGKARRRSEVHIEDIVFGDGGLWEEGDKRVVLKFKMRNGEGSTTTISMQSGGAAKRGLIDGGKWPKNLRGARKSDLEGAGWQLKGLAGGQKRAQKACIESRKKIIREGGAYLGGISEPRGKGIRKR